MKYAVVKTGGKQYTVSEGDILEVDRLTSIDKTVSLDSVLLFVDNDQVTIGNPYVSGASVTASIIKDTKGDKLRIAKYKAKVRYRRVTGFRSSLTQIKIDTIGSRPEKKTSSKEVKSEKIQVKTKNTQKKKALK